MLVLLANGRVIYAGKANYATKYFSMTDLGYRCPSDVNPADFLVDITTRMVNPDGADFPLEVEFLATTFNKHADEIAEYESVDEEAGLESDESFLRQLTWSRGNQRSSKLPLEGMKRADAEEVNKIQWNTSILNLASELFRLSGDNVIGWKDWYGHFQMHMHRELTVVWRNRNNTIIGVIMQYLVSATVFGVIVGLVGYHLHDPLVLYNTSTDTALGLQPETQNVITAVFFLLIILLVTGNTAVIPALCKRNAIFRHELQAGAYWPSTYWLACIVISAVLTLILQSAYTITVYFILALPLDSGFFFYFYAVCYLVSLISFFFAFFFATLFGDPEKAFAVFPIMLVFNAVFSGVLLPLDEIPPGWAWGTYISYLPWALRGIVVYILEQYDTGDVAIETVDFDNFNKLNTLYILAIYAMMLFLLTYIPMRPKASNLRHFDSLTVEEKIKLSNASAIEDDEIPTPESVPQWMSDFLSSPQYSLSSIRQQSCKSFTFIGDENYANRSPRIGPTVSSKMSPSPLSTTKSFFKSIRHLSSHKGSTIEISHLSYSVELPNNRDVFSRFTGSTENSDSSSNRSKVLLNNVTCSFHPGTLTALMGPSGAGKSTLLDIIAGRKTTGVITGILAYDGKEQSGSCISNDIIKKSCYVMQEDYHIPFLSVHQTMWYALSLRCTDAYIMKSAPRASKSLLSRSQAAASSTPVKPSSALETAKHNHITKILKMVDMDGYEDSKVIFLSGGQLRRLR